MKGTLLKKIEWHDLPVSKIDIGECDVSIFIENYEETTGKYKNFVLTLKEAEAYNFNVTGSLSPQDLKSLEISSFTYTISNSGRITGTIGLLPGGAGFWEISFSNAYFELQNA